MRNRSILLLAGLLAAMLAMWFIDSSYLASVDSANTTEHNRTQQNTTEHNRTQQNTTEHNRTQTPYIALT